MKYKIKSKNNTGFTLMELTIVLTLLLVILFGLSNFFDFSQKSYLITEAQSIIHDDINNVLLMLGNDIRSAARPDYDTNAVVVFKSNTASKAGDRIDIFDYKDGKYYKTSYRYIDNKLQRGLTEGNSAEAVKSADFVYETILEGVKYPESGELFTDKTTDTTIDRRTIEIDLYVIDPQKRVDNVFHYPVIFTSRTKGTP